jgi:hypothetical protein
MFGAIARRRGGLGGMSLHRVISCLILGTLPASLCLLCVSWAAGEVVTLSHEKDRVRVLIDGKPFTEYVFNCFGRPVLYPVVGPTGIDMTRHYPMREDVPGEPHDHPHHTSIWYSHSPVNGVNFFDTSAQCGKCVHEKVLEARSGSPRGVLKTTTQWVTPDKAKVILTDTRTLGFEVIHGVRTIDYDITLHASHGQVVLGDSDHGGLALRMHPNLSLAVQPKEKVQVKGRALNSEGVTADAGAGAMGKPVWGKRARWIDYYGEVNGRTVGLAIFDHPSNPRHPTHWMARGYGYVAACPFGLNSFEGKPPGSGDMTIPAGGDLTFRYRLVFHEGDPKQAGVEAMWKEYAKR